MVNNKILVVDDNEINLKLIERIILTHTNHEVITAKNGEEAVNLAKKEEPFLIFMDMMMPVVDGYKATKEIKKLENCKDIPVVAITAVNTKEAIKEVFDSGCEDILPKPIDIKTVIDIVNIFYKKISSKNN